MTELTKKEIKIGKKQIEGPLILCWVLAILLGIGIFSGFAWGPIGFVTDYLEAPFTFLAISDLARNFVGFPFRMMYSLLAALVVTMVFFFPIGTIFGGIMWKRFNHPMAKKYLNYEDEHTMEEDEEEEKKKK